MYSFKEGYSDQDLLGLNYYLNKVNEYGLNLGDPEMRRALSQEMERRGLDPEEDKFRQEAIVSIKSYNGMDTSLDVCNHPRPYKEQPKTIEEDIMFILVTIENGTVRDGLTDFGYRTPKEAKEGALGFGGKLLNTELDSTILEKFKDDLPSNIDVVD